MKRILIPLVVSLILVQPVCAQTVEPPSQAEVERLRQEAQQAGANAGTAQNQAAAYQAAANSASARAVSEQQRSNDLYAKSQQLADYLAALGLAQEAQKATENSRALYEQARDATQRQALYTTLAADYRKIESSKYLQAEHLLLGMVASAVQDTQREMINGLILRSAVDSQNDEINWLRRANIMAAIVSVLALFAVGLALATKKRPSMAPVAAEPAPVQARDEIVDAVPSSGTLLRVKHDPAAGDALSGLHFRKPTHDPTPN